MIPEIKVAALIAYFFRVAFPSSCRSICACRGPSQAKNAVTRFLDIDERIGVPNKLLGPESPTTNVICGGPQFASRDRGSAVSSSTADPLSEYHGRGPMPTRYRKQSTGVEGGPGCGYRLPRTATAVPATGRWGSRRALAKELDLSCGTNFGCRKTQKVGMETSGA
jgi:hypothetical protein